MKTNDSSIKVPLSPDSEGAATGREKTESKSKAWWPRFSFVEYVMMATPLVTILWLWLYSLLPSTPQ